MNTPGDSISLSVPPSLHGAPADHVALACSGLSAGQVQAIIAHGGLWVDGQRERDGTVKLNAGSTLKLRTPPGGHYHEATVAAGDLLHEDGLLLALNKHPGDYVVPTPWDTHGDVATMLQHFLVARDGQAPPLHLAHRLDRDTSGVLLLSKNPQANAPLHRAFAQGLARKRYLALCIGVPADQSFGAHTGLGRGPGGGFYVYPLEAVGSRAATGHPPILAAETAFSLVAAFDGVALVEARPRTGRTHQIRLHLASLGHPILGDARYGGPMLLGDQPIPHHMLHAQHLALPHPAGGTLELEAPLPPAFAALLHRLRGT